MIAPAVIVPSVSRILPPHLEAWLNGTAIAGPGAAVTTLAKRVELSIGTTRASDCHLPTQRTSERPFCLEPIHTCALSPINPVEIGNNCRFVPNRSVPAPQPEPEPPTPKPPKMQKWEAQRELPPTFKLTLVPLHELVEPRATLSDIERARLERAQRYLTVRRMREVVKAA